MVPLLDYFAASSDPRQHTRVLSATIDGAHDFVETMPWRTKPAGVRTRAGVRANVQASTSDPRSRPGACLQWRIQRRPWRRQNSDGMVPVVHRASFRILRASYAAAWT